MFDIGWSELLVIAVVAIIVVGPKDLPKLMRSFGFYAGKLRRAAGDFQRQFEEAMREAEIAEVKKAIESVRDETPSLDLKAPIDKPVMLPKPAGAAAVEPVAAEAPPAPKPRPRAKRKPAKPKPESAKRGQPKKTNKTGKSGAEPAP